MLYVNLKNTQHVLPPCRNVKILDGHSGSDNF